MATPLVQKFSYQQSDSILTVSMYDITSLYPGNPTGYGNPSFSPSPLPADFTSLIGYIYFPDPTTLLPLRTAFDITNIIADYAVQLTPTLPTITTTPYIYDSVAVFGTSQKYPDGIYRFHTFGVDAGDNIYQTDYLVPFILQVRCCIKNLILVADSCTCHGVDTRALDWADTQLNLLYVKDRTTGKVSVAERCPMLNRAAKLIINAKAICASHNCPTCSTAKCGC